ncbi:MAG: S8 family serine peptidase [Rhodocyclaceae bacterium]|nr:S8 family serine peptidase [Rhodocyclaceae bacterium]MCA3173648.1 S8 family serine peptidase [Burkholderiales bacterium]MCA3653095.1 S8 family serine peptidase [Methylobacterium sp.]
MTLDSMNDSAPRYIGSYEGWLYGAGLAYTGLTVEREEIRYIAGVARLPQTVLPRDFGEYGGPSDKPRVLWSETSLTTQERREIPTYWPFVLDLGDPAGRKPAEFKDINETLRRLCAPLSADLFSKGITCQPAFRLNAPLIGACVNPASERSKARRIEAASCAAENGAPVVVAVIDDGIPFAHRNLLDSTGYSTRVEYCWLQGAASDWRLPYGRDLTRSEIDALRAKHGSDEDTIYAHSGALDIVTRQTPAIFRFGTHGSHVLDAAAGWRSGMRPQEMDRVRVVAVQLPPAVTIDTTGIGKDAFILDAFDYVFQCARKIAEAYCGDPNAPLSVIINLSYGYTDGPHDGSSLLEQAIRERIVAREKTGSPTKLVMPAGNSFADRVYGEVPVEAINSGKPYSIPWRLQPTDRTPNYLEVWLPFMASTPAAFSISIRSPIGEECSATQALNFDLAPQPATIINVDAALSLRGQTIGQCSVEAYNEKWVRILVSLAATETVDKALPAAPSGRWQVEILKTAGDELTSPVACRILRDNDPFGYSRGGRQSYFDDPLDPRFNERGELSRIETGEPAFVKRFGTLNGIATHDKVCVVGGYYGNTGRATEYSSAGPKPSGKALPSAGDVHVSAISDDSTVLRGVSSAGSRSGANFRLSGTSVAAPKVARLLALDTFLRELDLPSHLSPDERAEYAFRLANRVGI